MVDTVIVALPAVDDKVNRISSEKVPHLTLCYLGDQSGSDQLASVVEYVQHAASQLSPFYMTVDYRGTLGADQADVVFFEKDRWSFERVSDFRHYLLLNDTIKMMYDSQTQFPEWTPHLTLGYPETPANEDDSDYPGIHSVEFDRIAVWMGDYSGPEFRLKYDELAADSSAAWSDLKTLRAGAIAASNIFGEDPKAAKQYGTKGMRWGVRKDEATSRGGASKGPTSVVVAQKKPGTFAKAEGGSGHPLHEDAANALVARQKAKASTTDALSNVELKQAVERMRLEQQYSQLSFQSDRRSKGQRFLAGFFGKPKPTKYVDIHEDAGDKTAEAVKKALAARAAATAAKAAAGA